MTRQGQRFSFVPGGEVRVGYDGGRFTATPRQLASYAESAEEYGITGDIQEFVDSSCRVSTSGAAGRRRILVQTGRSRPLG